MKQTFDQLRGAILDKAFKVYDGTIAVDIHDVGELINEAEAKWEADCCEWEHKEHYVNCFCKCHGIMVEHDWAIGFKFCPYCGKPIKISEVE